MYFFSKTITVTLKAALPYACMYVCMYSFSIIMNNTGMMWLNWLLQ